MTHHRHHIDCEDEYCDYCTGELWQKERVQSLRSKSREVCRIGWEKMRNRKPETEEDMQALKREPETLTIEEIELPE